MKKSLIALAVAGAFVAPVAMADSNVVVYGVANVSVDVTNTGDGRTLAGVARPGFSSNKVSSNTSRLGLKGSEDLGDGLSAIWQIESLISIDGGATGNNGNLLATRNTFAGLSGGFGTVLLGRHDTPYKIATRSYDLFGDTIADNRALMGQGAASFDGRQPDVLAYVSPSMGGLTVIGAYVAGAEGQTASTQSKGNAYSLAGLYANGPFSASLAYEQHNIGSAPGTVGVPALFVGAAVNSVQESAWKLGAGYKADAFEVNAVYEKTKDNFGTLVPLALASNDLTGHRAYYLSGKVNVTPNDALKLAYGNSGNLNALGVAAAAANTGANQASVGYDHNFSKRTMVYALYTRLNNQSSAAYTIGAAGIGNGTVFQNGLGAKPSSFSLGVKHSF